MVRDVNNFRASGRKHIFSVSLLIDLYLLSTYHNLKVYHLTSPSSKDIYWWRRQDFDLVLPQATYQSRGADFFGEQQSSVVSKEVRETVEGDHLPRISLAFPYIILPLRVAVSIFIENLVFPRPKSQLPRPILRA
jgi:hypothetical protein